MFCAALASGPEFGTKCVDLIKAIPTSSSWYVCYCTKLLMFVQALSHQELFEKILLLTPFTSKLLVAAQRYVTVSIHIFGAICIHVCVLCLGISR